MCSALDVLIFPIGEKMNVIVFDIFKELAEKQTQTLTVVTYDQEFAKNTHRIKSCILYIKL